MSTEYWDSETEEKITLLAKKFVTSLLDIALELASKADSSRRKDQSEGVDVADDNLGEQTDPDVVQETSKGEVESKLGTVRRGRGPSGGPGNRYD